MNSLKWLYDKGYLYHGASILQYLTTNSFLEKKLFDVTYYSGGDLSDYYDIGITVNLRSSLSDDSTLCEQLAEICRVVFHICHGTELIKWCGSEEQALKGFVRRGRFYRLVPCGRYDIPLVKRRDFIIYARAECTEEVIDRVLEGRTVDLEGYGPRREQWIREAYLEANRRMA